MANTERMITVERLKGLAGYIRTEAECGYYGIEMMGMRSGYQNARFSLKGILDLLDELDCALDIAQAFKWIESGK